MEITFSIDRLNKQLGTYNNTAIIFTDDNKINLTDMWNASDGRAGQQPKHWSTLVSTEKFLESLGNQLNVEKVDLLEKLPGRDPFPI